MKRTFFAILAASVVGVASAATLYDNGPTVTHAGQGFGGADVSMCGLDPNTAGSTVKQIDGTIDYFRIADDFTMTQAFTLDEVVMQAYESQNTTGTASWTVREINLWSGEPGNGGTIIASASSTSHVASNVYRVFNGVANLQNTTRRINTITGQFGGLSLPAGTYWVDLQVETTSTLNSFANYVMDPNTSNPNDPILRLGNGHQRTSTGVWGVALIAKLDGSTVTPEYPFLIKGNVGPTTETLAPTSEQILLGTTGSGGNLASWASNDGNIRNICKFFVPFPTSPFIRANLNYTTTKAAASVTAISFNTRIGSKTGGGQAITLKVQNKTTSAFVNTSVVNQSVGSLPHDSTGAASGTLADYVGGGGAMTGQIEVSAVGFQVVAFPCTGFDSANMVVTG